MAWWDEVTGQATPQEQRRLSAPQATTAPVWSSADTRGAAQAIANPVTQRSLPPKPQPARPTQTPAPTRTYSNLSPEEQFDAIQQRGSATNADLWVDRASPLTQLRQQNDVKAAELWDGQFPRAATLTTPAPQRTGSPTGIQQLQQKRRDKLANDRPLRLASTRQLSVDEYNALDERQKAAVQFNTGLIGAARKDDETGTSIATSDYLKRLDLYPRSERELNEFLQLDRAIGKSLLDKLSNASREASKTDYPKPYEPPTVDEEKFGNASYAAERMAESLSQALGGTGSRTLDRPETTPTGYGDSPADRVVQQAYYWMIDQQYDMKTQDVVDGLAQMNAAEGTKVTPQEVWDFLTAQLDATNLARVRTKDRPVIAPERSPFTGETISPRDIEDIRQRYLGGGGGS